MRREAPPAARAAALARVAAGEPIEKAREDWRLELIREALGDDKFLAVSTAIAKSIEAGDEPVVFYGYRATHLLRKARHDLRHPKTGRFIPTPTSANEHAALGILFRKHSGNVLPVLRNLR